ncbi:hypothetical protein JTB14_036041 [Gonioctena quinquepunctata]|nr:hypothetical protein JTB14_036041 [Gonioctena quinquepunctata]
MVDRRQRHNNLVFYGIEKESTETQYCLIENIVEISRKKLEVQLKESDINDIFRLGKKSGQETCITFPNLPHETPGNLEKRAKIKKQESFVAEDLSESDLKQRKISIERLKEARNNNKKASIKGNKLIGDGEEYTASDISILSISQADIIFHLYRGKLQVSHQLLPPRK